MANGFSIFENEEEETRKLDMVIVPQNFESIKVITDHQHAKLPELFKSYTAHFNEQLTRLKEYLNSHNDLIAIADNFYYTRKLNAVFPKINKTKTKNGMVM
uniref:Uncharacterized protein n=1 Tax=uncultured bacterium contig00062 TaxID=1181545 RepID=A0A806K1Q3_9BACT|nr:hypothetical protein [uncultured bacterium contig00062]